MQYRRLTLQAVNESEEENVRRCAQSSAIKQTDGPFRLVAMVAGFHEDKVSFPILPSRSVRLLEHSSRGEIHQQKQTERNPLRQVCVSSTGEIVGAHSRGASGRDALVVLNSTLKSLEVFVAQDGVVGGVPQIGEKEPEKRNPGTAVPHRTERDLGHQVPPSSSVRVLYRFASSNDNDLPLKDGHRRPARLVSERESPRRATSGDEVEVIADRLDCHQPFHLVEACDLLLDLRRRICRARGQVLPDVALFPKDG